MKIAVFSDLHIEFGKPVEIDCSDADIIILAGDCHHGDGIIRFAGELREQYRVPVLVVAGNHEFYNGKYEETLEWLRASAKRNSVNFLENDCLVLNDVRFLGCTLWTNFSLYGIEKREILQNVADDSISDFWSIRFKGRRFLPRNAVDLYNESYAWLDQELQKPFGGKTVVITHFAPHLAAKHSRYPADDPLSPYFVSDCSTLMRTYSIDLWIYGHTHSSIDLALENGTRLVSNQRGYPNEDPAYTQFSVNKIVEI